MSRVHDALKSGGGRTIHSQPRFPPLVIPMFAAIRMLHAEEPSYNRNCRARHHLREPEIIQLVARLRPACCRNAIDVQAYAIFGERVAGCCRVRRQRS